MSRKKVLLIGNCVVDEIMHLAAYPDEDDETRALDKTLEAGGNACNSARILAQLGLDASLLASLGGDPQSDSLRAQLAHAGVSTAHCIVHPDGMAPLSSIWLNRQNGSRTIVHHRHLPELTLAELQQVDPRDYHWIHVEGRNIDVLSEYLPWLSAFAIPVSLEIEKPLPGIENLCSFADTIIISSQYVKSQHTDAGNCLTQMARRNPSARIICTQGKNGVIASDAGGSILQIAAPPVARVVDTIGAGDSFIAGLISASLSRPDFKSTLEFANRIAANKVQQQGMKLHAHEQ